jgi:hypothetical protein
MIKYLAIPVGDYGTVKLEIEPTNTIAAFQELGIDISQHVSVDSLEELSLREEIGKATQTVTVEATQAFDRMMDTVRALACGFKTSINQLGKKFRPDKVSVEFGLGLKADAGVVLTQAGTETAVKVTLTWKTAEGQNKDNGHQG